MNKKLFKRRGYITLEGPGWTYTSPNKSWILREKKSRPEINPQTKLPVDNEKRALIKKFELELLHRHRKPEIPKFLKGISPSNRALRKFIACFGGYPKNISEFMQFLHTYKITFAWEKEKG